MSESEGRKPMLQLKDSQVERGSSLFPCLFVLFRLSPKRVRLTYAGEGVCLTQPTDSNMNLMQMIHPHRHASVWDQLPVQP